MTRARTNADQAHTESVESIPHIIPGVLYPAVAGKLLDGSTSHGATYGVAQSDGRSYYYTDIKGSKPIKDPRIGAYFGSQRHKFKSLQLLEQETATEGKNIYSVDGREWCRAYSTGGGWLVEHASAGTCITSFTDCTGCFLEITGYFNDINFLIYTGTNRCDDIDISVNGTLSVDGSNHCRTTVGSPLDARYVDAQSAINTGSTLQTSLGTTPKINTIRYEMKTGSGEYVPIGGIELIAQDTSSTANKSKIQIPSQNVVSYGKKFTVSGTPHYDPFNGFVNDTTLFSSVVDVATSLGLGTATTWGAPWDKGGNDHIRPFNGGRVVKWVDSSGNIKTSVTMMPPNAQNIKTTVSNEITTASATNTHTINFSDDAVDQSLSEVAKTFHIREFGNGSANAGTGGSWKDISMTHGTQEARAFVMDDGLTSFSGNLVKESGGVSTYIQADTGYWYLTFIGTGISIRAIGYGAGYYSIAQNLPYGTHVLKCVRDGGPADYTLDGVAISNVTGDTYGDVGEVTIYQPKMPPIPEDAVVIADYMLMADFVAQTSEDVSHVSKGVRLIAPSRDMFYDRSAGSFHPSPFVAEPGASQFHINCWQGNASGTETRILPVFGDSFCMTFSTNSDTNTTAMPLTAGSAGTTALDNWTLTSGGSSVTSLSAAGSLVCAASSAKGFVCAKAGASVDLGIQQLKSVGTIASGGYHYQRTFGVHTPIHTSSHYQTFETPFLHELVGGDRNMEQNNLIVTPDGKTWDEVTRDTSYIGNMVVNITTADTHASGATVIFDEIRGSLGTYRGLGTKDWTIAYDRLICLKVGQYEAIIVCNEDDTGYTTIKLNGTDQVYSYQGSSASPKTKNFSYSFFAHKGDYLQLVGQFGHDTNIFNNFQIKRL